MMDPEVADALKEPRSALETDLLSFCMRRINDSERRWSERHPRWRESERLDRAFRTADEQDKQTRGDQLTEGVEKIVVPYSYAVIRSIMAFFMTVFTQRKPLIPVEGIGPRDVRGAMLMEVLLDQQMERMEPTGTLILYQWLLDSLRYGVGIIKNTWTIREWPELVRNVIPSPAGGYIDDIVEKNVIAYEGNEALNVIPFDFLADPRRPLSEFQRGEFVAHRMRRSWTELEQKEEQGLYVGIEHIPRGGRGSGTDEGYGGGAQSDLARISDMSEIDIEQSGVAIGAGSTQQRPYASLHEMWAYVKPRDLGLPDRSDGSTARLWVFTIANRSKVIRAEAANLPGHRFPFEILELNYDVHSPANTGIIETFRGLQYHLSWLFNSRMQAVRKTLTNQSVVDPSMIEETDLLDTSIGGYLRLKRQYYGAGQIDQAIHPLNITDTTQSHGQDSQVVTSLIHYIVGVSPQMFGQVNSGRRAATEVQGQLNLSAGRQKMLIEVACSQGLKPWAMQMGRNTQVFASEQQLALKPQYAQALGAPFVQVTPDMLQGEFTYPFTDQGFPSDRMFEANMWKELLLPLIQSGQAMPFLMQIFPTMMGRYLRALGIKDLQSFGVPPIPNLVIMPDEQVQQQMQAGNLAPAQNPATQPSDGFPLPGGNGTPNIGANGMGGGA